MAIRGERDPLPYYQWYVKDYRANRKVQAMSYVERGLYRELLDEVWEEGRIPDDPVQLAKICACPVGIMTKAWLNIRDCFKPLPGLDGMFLTNAKLESIRQKAEAARDVAIRAGQRSGEVRRMNARSTTLNERTPTEQNRTKQSSNSASAAQPLGRAASSADQLASPDEIRAIFANLKTRGMP